MAYSRKDVTDGIQKKKRKSLQADELIDKIDKAIEDPFSKDEDDEKKEEIPDEKDEDEGEPVHIDEDEMDREFAEEFNPKKKDKKKKERPEKVYRENSTSVNIPLIIFIAITILCAIVSFVATIIHSDSNILPIISGAVLCLFTIVYLIVCITTKDRKDFPIFISTLLLLAFFILGMNLPVQETSIVSHKVQNFSGKNLTDVVKWANKNKIKVTQEYEYSDMVPEYEIISQNIKVGTDLRDIDEIVVAVSEGPNPYKEVIVPSMLTWDSERVINYVLTNHLSNVLIEFVESDQVKDTVIEQSRSGNLKRNEELKLVFSFGEEGSSSEIKLIDFTNKTKFEIEFYMKQNQLTYDFIYDFSDTIKKGYGLQQSIMGGEVVPAGEKIQVTISKGPKIVIPELDGMDVNDLTEWAIQNHLKIEFIDQYDDTVKRGKVISIDKEKGDVVEQGTLLKVTLSLGTLKMPKYKNVDDFYKWADKYGIKYEIAHEFSNSVAAGEVIRYSHKVGSVIKNDEVITVTISDGSKMTVPNLKGLTKSEAIKKLKNANLNYNFVYRKNSAKKDTVIAQSISSGSEVSSGTTITVTLSNGNSGNNNPTVDPKPSSSPTPSASPSPSPSPSESPTPSCNSCNITGIKNQVYNNYTGYQDTANALIQYIEGQCPGIDVQVRSTDSDKASGVFVTGFYQGDKDNDGNPLTSCSVVYIYLAK